MAELQLEGFPLDQWLITHATAAMSWWGTKEESVRQLVHGVGKIHSVLKVVAIVSAPAPFL